MKIQEESVVFYSEEHQVWVNKNGFLHRLDGHAIRFEKREDFL